MKFGLVVPTCREGFYVPVPFGRPDHFVKAAKMAEKLGFYAVWANDHLNPTKDARFRYPLPPNLYESLITLSFIASATSRVKIGTAAMVMPLRDVIVLAKQISTLDVLSTGRLLLGVGVGVYKEEFETVQPRLRGANRGIMMEEALEALTALFIQDGVTFKGRYYEFQEVALNPKPIQKPFPFYISGKPAETLKRIARWGRGWLLSGSSVEGIRERIDSLKPVLEERGRKLSELDIATTVGLSIASSYEKAAKKFQDNLESRGPETKGRHYIKTNNLMGKPSEIASQIENLAKEGITHCILQEFPVDSFDEMLEQVQMFGEQVLPLVKDL